MPLSSVTISDVKARLESKIHGSNLSKVRDIYGLMYEAAGNLLLFINPKETHRYAPVENALYDQVYTYAAPDDVKGSQFTDFRPQANRTTSDNFTKTGSEEFDINKINNTFAVDNDTGIKTIRISKKLNAGTLVHDANSLTAQGTWTVGGSGTNLSLDTVNKITGTGSLRFDINSAGSSSFVENSTFTPVDLSIYKNVGALFVWVYIPSITVITSVSLRWGSSSSDYYSATVTSSSSNTAFVVGWNLLRFDWTAASTTGTPVDTAIDYVRVSFAHTTSAVSAVRVDNIIAKLGSIYEAGYFSKYLFRSSAGTWKDKPTVDTDLVNLDTESFNLFLYELCELVAVEIQGSDSAFDTEYWRTKKAEVWKEYKAANKDSSSKQRNTYYRMSRR